MGNILSKGAKKKPRVAPVHATQGKIGALQISGKYDTVFPKEAMT